jgi:hypothetical protein
LAKGPNPSSFSHLDIEKSQKILTDWHTP